MRANADWCGLLWQTWRSARCEEVLQGMREDVPEGYRKFTQEYFKRLTEVKNQKP